MNKMLKAVAFATLGLSLAGSVSADEVGFFVSGGNSSKFERFQFNCGGDHVVLTKICSVPGKGVFFMGNLKSRTIVNPQFDGEPMLDKDGNPVRELGRYWNDTKLSARGCNNFEMGLSQRFVYYTISQTNPSAGTGDYISKVESK